MYAKEAWAALRRTVHVGRGGGRHSGNRAGKRRTEECIGGQAVRHGEVCCRTACMLLAGASASGALCVGCRGGTVYVSSRILRSVYPVRGCASESGRCRGRYVFVGLRFGTVRGRYDSVRRRGQAKSSVGRSSSVASRRSACGGCPNRGIPAGQQDGIRHTVSVLSAAVGGRGM